MIISTQSGLDSILSQLQDANETAPGGDPAKNNDVIIGSNGAETETGKLGNDLLFGAEGNDVLLGGAGNDTLFGGTGDDQLGGGTGDDDLTGGDGVDQLLGGSGADKFTYAGNLFANGAVAPAGQTGINVLNKPDIVFDFTPGEDKFAFSKADSGIQNVNFQIGTSSQIGNGNVIVLQDSFAAAGGAARAIANNPNVTAKEGIFAYFNTTLGLTRLVYSKDLANGGDISVLANLDNQRGAVGQAAISAFTAQDFTLF